MKTFEYIFSFIIAILVIFLSQRWSESDYLEKGIIVAIIVLLTTHLIFQIASSFKEKKEDKVKKEKEELIERVNAKYGDISTKGSDLGYIGGSRLDDNIWKKNRDGTYLAYIFNGEYHEDPEPLMNIKFIEGRLIINTIIRDFDGEVIAAIENSVWTVFSDDYEYNDDGVNNFEMVTKGEREVHFQIITEDEKTQMTGYFLNKDGNGFLFQYNSELDKIFPIYGINEKTKKIDRRKIERKFQYPRAKFYGQKQ